jgi:hypothetical protein
MGDTYIINILLTCYDFVEQFHLEKLTVSQEIPIKFRAQEFMTSYQVKIKFKAVLAVAFSLN